MTRRMLARLTDFVPRRMRPWLAKKIIGAYQHQHTNPDGTVRPFNHEEIVTMHVVARWSQGNR